MTMFASAERDNTALYEMPELWEGMGDSYYHEKLRLVVGIVPPDVRTIVDIGCGKGVVSARLQERYNVVTTDRSWTAVKEAAFARTSRSQLSAEQLPFKSRSFDLVMSFQVLEHLPGHILGPAVHEMARVAAKYILVSVPYRDRLRQQFARCAECRHIYNAWGHLRTFRNISDVRHLFPGFELRLHAYCGRENEYMSVPALWARQRLGGRWAVNPAAVCPACGSRAQQMSRYPRALIASAIDRIDALMPKRKEFFWLVCLFKRAV